MSAPTVSELGALAGKTVSAEQGAAVLSVVTSMAKAYTRDVGFTDGVPNADIQAVTLTASCRLLAHPRQISMSEAKGPESVDLRGSFSGWTSSELLTLNRYRVRAL